MKSKKNNSVLLVILILAVAALGIIFIVGFNQNKKMAEVSELVTDQNLSSSEPTDETLSDVLNFSAEYPSVGEDNIFVYRTGQEIIDILKNGTGIVYLGFKECGWCQAYAPYLQDVARGADLEKIYYFDIRQDRSENTETYQQIVALLGDNLDFDDEGKPRIFVPDVTFVKNGEIIGHNNDTSMNTVEEHGTPEEYWTSDRVEILKGELNTYASQLTGGACSALGSICN